jgi:hypothetical protein
MATQETPAGRADRELAHPDAVDGGLKDAIDRELFRLKALRDTAPSLRGMAEWCVELEETMGGRPPTRGYDPLVLTASWERS